MMASMAPEALTLKHALGGLSTKNMNSFSHIGFITRILLYELLYTAVYETMLSRRAPRAA